MSDQSFLRTAGIFACPSCGEMIYSDSERCRFCSAPIDYEVAVRGAELQAQVNSACNQAKVVRNLAGVMWMFLLLSTVPSFGWSFVALVVGLPVWLIFWYANFGRLETADPDYLVARRDWKIAVLLCIPAVILQILIMFRESPF